MKKDKNFDIIVAGGGPSGLTLSILLARAGAKTACIDREIPQKQGHDDTDGRAIAVSYGSRKVFETAGVWKDIAPHACPINSIHITDGDSPVLLEFGPEDSDGETFGWIAGIGVIRRALHKRAAALKNLSHIAPAAIRDYEVTDTCATACLEDGRTLGARLIAGADGRNSFTREWMEIDSRGWGYGQRALVCTVIHEHPHRHVAVENFRPEGPFAILPMTDDEDGHHRSSIVWTEHDKGASRFTSCREDIFNAALAARFPSWYGRVRLAGKRFSYPLGLIHAHKYIGTRMALIADAGHGIHPIAGQGLNMGLRDVAELAGLIKTALEDGTDPGAPEILQKYQRARRFDNTAMAGATDILTRLFSNNLAPVSLARRAGLKMVARLPSAKKFFVSQAMGTAGILPDMIREAKTG